MNIKAKSISEAWFQALYHLPDHCYKQDIQAGSFADDYRLQYPWLAIEIEQYLNDTIPIVPEGIPAPTTQGYVVDYFVEYLLPSGYPKKANEVYSYATRIGEQLNSLIKMLSNNPHNNQMTLEIGRPEDITLSEPACLRVLDFKVVNNALDVSMFFRSNDLYSGFPTNLAGIALLCEYISNMAGMPRGKMYYASPGAHIYGKYKEIVETRVGRKFK